MTNHFGSGWERKRTPDNGAAFEEWQRKRQTALRNGECGLELIHYADFTDYAKLIVRKDNWREVFSSVFLDDSELRFAFRRIERIRNVPMHARIVTKSDLLILGLETKLILSAIGVLERD